MRAAPQAQDCMRHCGGLRRVLAAVSFDLSAEVDTPPATLHDGMVQDPEAQQEALPSEPLPPPQQQHGSVSCDAQHEAPLASQQAQQAKQLQQRERQAGGRAEGSLHFRLEDYSAVQHLLRRAGEAAGLTLLTHFDQIPQPTLDSYMCDPTLH